MFWSTPQAPDAMPGLITSVTLVSSGQRLMSESERELPMR